MTIRILFVDDEEADIIRFKRAARKAGIRRGIDVCRNASDALTLLAPQAAASRADSAYFLVSDLKMPLMMGTQLVARVRELGMAQLPAFILSSSDSAADIEEALSTGANGYIVKCESEAEYLGVVRWLEGCCERIDDGRPLQEGAHCNSGRPAQVIAGPVAYSSPN